METATLVEATRLLSAEDASADKDTPGTAVEFARFRAPLDNSLIKEVALSAH